MSIIQEMSSICSSFLYFLFVFVVTLQVSLLAKMLCCSDAGASKNACFALSCLATSKEGHTRLLKVQLSHESSALHDAPQANRPCDHSHCFCFQNHRPEDTQCFRLPKKQFITYTAFVSRTTILKTCCARSRSC